MIRTFIYGSCVSRDTFEYLPQNRFALRGYIARQSLISGMASQPPQAPDFPSTGSAFQDRMLHGDWTSSLAPTLRSIVGEVDLILWDLCDERFGVQEVLTGSPRAPAYSTISVDSMRLPAGAAIPRGLSTKTYRFGTVAHRLRFYRAVVAFTRLLNELHLQDRLILVAPAWARRTADGSATPGSFSLTPERANRLFADYHRTVLYHLEVPIVATLRPPLSDPAHQWGPAPFHYAPGVYHELAQGIAAFARDLPPNRHQEPRLTDPTTARSRAQTEPHPRGVPPAKVQCRVTPTRINPRTKLPEGTHPYYRVPEVHQRSLGSLRLDGQPTAVHRVPIHNGMTLNFYSRLTKSDELFVSLHGAISPERYPQFWRVSSLRDKAPSILSFADPTLQLDPHHKLSLAWFLGGAAWDPQSMLLQVIRKALGKTGAKHVAFIGGSGGGFAALRASAAIPGSMAMAIDPQTNLARYNRDVTGRYFSIAWPGWDQTKLITAFPDRFDMVEHYRSRRPQNFVYYAQNSRDAHHVPHHYTPFRSNSVMESDRGPDRTGSRMYALYEGEVAGHGQITRREFDQHFACAVSMWRKFRTQ